MVGDMENLKVYVKNEVESEEFQKLFFELGYYWYSENSIDKNNIVEPSSPYPRYIHTNEFGRMYYCAEYNSGSLKTKQQLRDLVVLKRNDVNDANYESESGNRKYYLTDAEFFEFINGAWVNIDELAEGMSFKFINKESEVKMKEYLDTNYELRSVKQTSGDNRVPDSWIEVPEGAEIAVQGALLKKVVFYKENGEYQFDDKWIECGFDNGVIHHNLKFFLDYDKRNRIVWQRLDSKRETTNTSTKEKLKFIEKWLNGEKIQYILGVESEKTQPDKSQWHNFTEGAMRYIKRSDIKFREAPEYVTINGIEFKSVESLLKYVKNNFDLEDGE